MLAVVYEDSRIFEQNIYGTRTEFEIYNLKFIFIFVNEQWFLKLPREVTWKKRDQILPGRMISLSRTDEDHDCEIWFYEDASELYHKYALKDHLCIGPLGEDDLFSDERILIDTEHQYLKAADGEIGLNGKLVNEGYYKVGDVIQIKYLRIIIGSDFVMVRGTVLTSLPAYVMEKTAIPIPIQKWKRQFFQPVTSLPEKIILKAHGRIAPRSSDHLFAMMLPAVMMLSSTLLVGLFSAYRSYMNGHELIDAAPSVVMPGMMLISTMISQPLVRHSRNQKYQKEEQQEIKKYAEYLSDKRREILSAQQNHFFSLNETCVSITMLLHQLSEHLVPQNTIGLTAGWYQSELTAELQLEKNEDDIPDIQRYKEDFMNEMQRRVMQPLLLTENTKIILEGPGQISLFLSLLIQAGIYREDVALMCDEEFIHQYQFICRLPGLCSGLERRICLHDHAEYQSEHTLIFTKGQEKCSIVFLKADAQEDLILHVGNDTWCYDLRDHHRYQFKPNLFQGGFPDCAIPCPAFRQQRTPSFLDLYDVNESRDLQIIERWQNNSNSRCLSACIGINDNASRISLDLSEKKNGPHGLIAGTTGSGKSELILTMLLSLMINYSPLDLQIAFIDFKGGGSSQTFEVLGKPMPHITGILSNLDQNNTDRVLYALKNECIRRQKALHDTGLQYHVSVMNLSDYRMLHKRYTGLQPIPDLIIVVDEFAELKAQSHEMLDQLISIARIGRSLGIHLILSTQKPAGVINDQIWSNSHFKICLKVSEKQDSMEVLHAPDAISLKRPGEFIMECDGEMQKGICGYSGYRRSQQKIHLDVVGYNGAVKEEFASYGELAQPEILSVCQEIYRAWNEKTTLPPLWLSPIQKCGFYELTAHHAIGKIDDYYQQKQPYCYFNYSAQEHWAFLSPDCSITECMIFNIVSVMKRENANLYLIDDRRQYQMNDVVYFFNKEIGEQTELIKRCRNGTEKKLIIVADTSRFYQFSAAWNVHDLLEHAQEYNIQFVFFLSLTNAMPYHDLNLIAHKICLSNENCEDMSSFLGIRVRKPVKEKDGGLLFQEHLLSIRLASDDQTGSSEII